MTLKRLRLGRSGESLARKHLEERGYRIIEENYRTRAGEIDLIGFDGEVLAFIEVKTRSTRRFGDPLEAVTFAKRRQIARVALEYLNRNDYHNRPARFDVVAILTDPKVRIEVVKNAFLLPEESPG